MSFGKTITLSNGAILPQIGLGTWQSEPKEVEFAVEHAVRHGYRHLDLAMCYENQHEVGAALKKVIPSVVKREELFITSKLWNTGHRPHLVEKELNETLSLLGLEYLDLYLIHWPVAFNPVNEDTPWEELYPPHPTKEGQVSLDTETSLVDTWKAMIALPKSKVRAIGVSNFSIHQIEELIRVTGVVPVVNQIEAHPYLLQPELVKYCAEKNIHLTAYSPLGNNSIGKPKLTEHPVINNIAKKLDATPAQVLIAWGAAQGKSVIPKSVHGDRIESNFKQIELPEDDIKEINGLEAKEGRERFNYPYRYTPWWDISIFDEEVDGKANFKVKVL